MYHVDLSLQQPHLLGTFDFNLFLRKNLLPCKIRRLWTSRLQSVRVLKVVLLDNNDSRDWIVREIRRKLPDVQVQTEIPLPQDAHLPKAHHRRLDHLCFGPITIAQTKGFDLTI